MPADAFEPIAEQLLVVFCHLFERQPLHRSSLLHPERYLASPSKVGGWAAGWLGGWV